MIFTGISSLAVIGSLAVFGGILAVLHLLRTRPRPVLMVTTLFWEEARSATRARTLLHQFQQRAVLLLLLAAAALMVFSTSQPVVQSATQPARYVVLVLDAGLSMQAAAADAGKPRFDEARSAAEEVIATLGRRDRLAVVAVDPTPRVIHRFDQPRAVAFRQLRPLRPASQPADATAALRLADSLLADRASDDPGRILWVTDRRTTDVEDHRIAAGTPARLIPIQVGESLSNAALLAVSFRPDEAAPSRGRLHVRAGWWGETTATVRMVATAETSGAVVLDQEVAVSASGAVDAVSAPIPADGSVVEVRVRETEGVPGDNAVRLRLPNRPPIVIAADPALPAALRLALAATPARVVPPTDPAGALRAVSTVPAQPSPDRPVIAVNQEGAQMEAGYQVKGAVGAAAVDGLDFEGAVCGAGPAIERSGDASAFQPLLTAGGRVVAALDTPRGQPPTLLLSAALFERASTVVNQPAFALMISRVVRRLAGWDETPVSLPARRAVTDPAWSHALAQVSPIITVPGDRVTSDLRAIDAERGEPISGAAGSAGGFLTLYQTLIVLALALVVLDAYLHARRGMV